MTALESLDALAARIADGSGPDRGLDAEFARVVCGWEFVRDFKGLAGWQGRPPGSLFFTDPIKPYTDALTGPGALFAAARTLWPECALRGETYLAIGGLSSSAFLDRRAVGAMWMSGEIIHPDLSRALMLAMVAAKRAEIAGGAT